MQKMEEFAENSIIDVLRTCREGMIARDLGDMLGKNQRHIKRVLNRMHAEGKVVIRRWVRGVRSGPIAAAYGLRTSPTDADKPKPKAYTDSQKSKRYRERHEAVCRVRELARKGVVGNPFIQLSGFRVRPVVRSKDIQAGVAKMFKKGMNITAIARHFNCSHCTVSRILAKKKLHQPKPRTIPKDIDQVIARGLAAGMTKIAIARETGLSREFIRKRARLLAETKLAA